jgi:hypothetical protein
MKRFACICSGRPRVRLPRIAGLWTVSVLALCASAPAAAERPEPCRPSGPTLLAAPSKATSVRGAFPFAVGECLRYVVSYLGVPVGQARIAVLGTGRLPNGVSVAHVAAVAKTNAFFSRIYKVEDRSEAWIDLDSMRTLKTRTETRHGRKRVSEEVRFDWETHFVSISRTKWHKDKHYDLGFDFGPDVHDTFDAFYAMRAARDDVGGRRELAVYASRKIYGLHLDYADAGRTESKALGAVEALRVIPRDTVDGERAGSGAGEVWVSRDDRRIPFRLDGWLNGEGFVLSGVAAELVEYLPGTRPARKVDILVAAPFPTREGRPDWDPPARLAKLRRDRGLVAWEKKTRLP